MKFSLSSFHNFFPFCHLGEFSSQEFSFIIDFPDSFSYFIFGENVTGILWCFELRKRGEKVAGWRWGNCESFSFKFDGWGGKLKLQSVLKVRIKIAGARDFSAPENLSFQTSIQHQQPPEQPHQSVKITQSEIIPIIEFTEIRRRKSSTKMFFLSRPHQKTQKIFYFVPGDAQAVRVCTFESIWSIWPSSQRRVRVIPSAIKTLWHRQNRKIIYDKQPRKQTEKDEGKVGDQMCK
jgi:hypothetical protein